MSFARRCSGGCACHDGARRRRVSREGVPRGTVELVNVIYHKPLMMHHW